MTDFPSSPNIQYDELSDTQKETFINLIIIDLQNKVGKHHEILVTGNHEPPLTQRMKNMEDYISSIRYWVRFLAGAIVLETISILVATFVYLIKLYPILSKISP